MYLILTIKLLVLSNLNRKKYENKRHKLLTKFQIGVTRVINNTISIYKFTNLISLFLILFGLFINPKSVIF